MRAAWLFPVNRRCGISIYSDRYVKELSKTIQIEVIDTEQILCRDRNIINKINRCDLLHVQYEPSLFIKKGYDYYPRLLRRVNVPVFITNHEVYERFPGVFPRSEINGNFIIRNIKKIIYDIKHPVVNAYRKNMNKSMRVGTIIVQYEYQKKILEEKCSDTEDITVIPLPVVHKKEKNDAEYIEEAYDMEELLKGFISEKKTGNFVIGYNGFINPNYDYEFLFKILKAMDTNWKFIWIGGTRRSEDEDILKLIKSDIKKNGWSDRFIITGWLSEKKTHHILRALDCFAALFKNKSGSASFLEGFSEELITVAFKSPLTDELNKERQVLITSDYDLHSLVSAFKTALYDKSQRQTLRNNIRMFNRQYSYKKMSKKLIELYNKRLNN